MSLRTQFKSLLEPELMEGLVDKMLTLKLIRYAVGQATEAVEEIKLGPFPSWFSLYEVKLELWNRMGRNPIFSPSLIFIGTPVVVNEEGSLGISTNNYAPIEMIWMNMVPNSSGKRDIIPLVSPISLMTGAPDTRFVDSSGGQKAVGKDNRTRMTINDIFQLDTGKVIPELHVFLYSDLVDRIPGPRPLGERDIFGRVLPYFPFLDPTALPPATGVGATTQIILSQANQTSAALEQAKYLEELLITLGGELQMPKLDGVKFLRWVWNQTPDGWEGAAILFFGIKVTHDRPFMRFFSFGGQQPLTKIRVKGFLPIPDISDPNLLMTWRQDKNPDTGKDCTFLKLRLQEADELDSMPLYATMRVFNDGTADLLIMPPKQKRVLDPYSDLQDAPEVLDRSFADMPYVGKQPSLGQADVVFKIRIKREDTQITKTVLQSRLKMFSSVFQEIPALPDEQPLAMLRYKGVSNFNNEDRIFAFLTQIASHEMVEGESREETWAPRVSEEFQIPIDDARRQVIAWVAQKNEYTLAVPETKDYILNKNPGVDIAIFAQHPIYTFHVYRIQSFEIYRTIVNLLGILISAPADRFVRHVPAVPAYIPPPSPILAPKSPVADGIEEQEDVDANAAAFFPNDDDIPEFMRTGAAPAGAASAEEAFFPNNDDVPEFMKTTKPSEPIIGPVVAPATGPVVAILDEEDKKAAEAFKKPKDMKAIAVSKYYIDKLKVADPDLFNYQRKNTSERGYVSHCAANESRQPIVLDSEEYREMRSIYDGDDDIHFIVYPEDPSPDKFPKKQPSKDENMTGHLDGHLYPSDEEKEIITLVRYGSKAKRINYYFCPRLFCIRDRLMVRYNDFKATIDRDGKPKPANSCPFCIGILVNLDGIKDKDRDPNMTVLQRKTRPGSETERQVYIGFLGNKTTPTGLSLPCCFADGSDRFDINDPEFVRLGLRAPRQAVAPAVLPSIHEPAEAQGVADMLHGINVLEALNKKVPQQQQDPTYEPNYYRVIQGVSVKSIVDANRIPLEIVVPKPTAPDDPKAGPQIGLLPETLDKFFLQDSTSDKFADRLEIVRKLKPTAKGFLRLAVDNSVQNRPLGLFSAIAPFIGWQPSAEKLIDNMLDTRIPPRQFLQLNGGNLVHEFFNKCERKQQNDMRAWVAKYVGVDELKSSNIPAIERLMNAYECYKDYLHDPKQRKDLRVFYHALSEPGVIMTRGILFIVLEVTIEDVSIKTGEKIEYKREIKFEKVRCPPYPLSDGQQKADIGFLVHYNVVTRDRYNPEKKIYRNFGWEPLFHVDGTTPLPDGRHKPTLFFQRSQEASWPPIVQKRVAEFFYNCAAINRGPFTSQFGLDPNALISAQEIITGVRIQPNGIIRDSYNHLVGVAYRVTSGKSDIVAVPVADDGSIHFERRLFLDWDDFQPAPADVIVDFYNFNVVNTFPQYRGYVPKYLQRSRDTGKIIGVTLQNGFAIPASEPKDVGSVSEFRIVDVDDLEWDINRTIAYDDALRKVAFEEAEEKDPNDGKHIQLSGLSIQDEVEDVYQHLRLTFSNWLSTAGAGREIRDALHNILKRANLPLYEKRKRLDILLEDKVTRWLEPREGDDINEIGFLRVDCLVQSQNDCTGRCKWSSAATSGTANGTTSGPIGAAINGTKGTSAGTCKIHSPATVKPNGIVLHVPRMLYLRLVDELIRYASKREEIFLKHVPRLTIRKEAQRQGDQYIIPEGSPDWNTWWEHLRTEWMTPEKEESKFFDELYEPIPSGLPTDDTRSLPVALRDGLGAADPKTDRLVWNPSTTADMPFFFLKSVLRNHPITSKTEAMLDIGELGEIVRIANVQVLYFPNGTMTGSLRKKVAGATDAIIIATVDGTPGWISQRGTYGVKLPLIALPDSLSTYRLK